MLEKPALQDEKIISCLGIEYGIKISQLIFLPLGADINTAVYRAVTENDISFFVKLRKDNFDPTSVLLPAFLHEQNIPNIIPPIATVSGQLWSDIASFKLILYAFIEGRDGFHIDLSARHWFEFGGALRKIHNAEIPLSITRQIQRENYSPKWRDVVQGYLEHVQNDSFHDPISRKLADLLMTKRVEILDLLERTERLALKLQTDSPPVVVCHSDVHAGNILIDKQDHFHIVDWDNPILAPRERDLMFIGGGQGFRGHTPAEEQTLFYKGYGLCEINQFALAYYRYERIIDDIAAYCEELFSSVGSEEDRKQSFQYLRSNFLPQGTLDIAYTTDKTGFK
jgi:spectinomycin phosphotransferase